MPTTAQDYRPDLRNYSSIIEFREAIASKSEIIDKNEFVVSLCKEKSVLDMGCIDHSYETALDLGDNWIHEQIRKQAKTITGLDILEEDAKELNQRGYNIVTGDATNFSLGQTFDTIVAGDLIEHLSNVGGFLDCVREHMHEDSHFVVTTPNPFCIEQIWQAIFNRAVVVNTQHTAWLDPIVTWQVMERHGLKIVGFSWIDTRFRNYVWSTQWRHIANRLTDAAIKRVPLLRRDFAIVAARNDATSRLS